MPASAPTAAVTRPAPTSSSAPSPIPSKQVPTPSQQQGQSPPPQAGNTRNSTLSLYREHSAEHIDHL
ncbi:hypothetical protein HDU86_006825 [Geranomyces michiganensis]|nr:hypothetical protein HDU86_006825 [Geranomyces michiganensis]